MKGDGAGVAAEGEMPVENAVVGFPGRLVLVTGVRIPRGRQLERVPAGLLRRPAA